MSGRVPFTKGRTEGSHNGRTLNQHQGRHHGQRGRGNRNGNENGHRSQEDNWRIKQSDIETKKNNSYRQNVDHNRNPRRNNQNHDGPRRMGFNTVQNLLKNDNLEAVVFQLSSDRKGFKELLEDNKQSHDLLVCTVKLLSKVCDCPFQAAKTSLLNSVIGSCFFQSVTNYITTLIIQNDRDKRFNRYFWNDTDDFWHNVIKICKHLHEVIPSSSCESTLKLLKALKFIILPIEETHSIHISDSIKLEIDNLLDIIEKTSKEVERKKEICQSVSHNQEMEPPDDFRDINVYPSPVEITSRKPSFLRPNLVKGPYDDVDHYLDVQFRLLREDFVLPLRNGICSYIENPKSKLDDIKIYHHVKFVNREVVTEQNCFRIQYDFSKKIKSFEYENSKRFMFGSLLCFTPDKFKSILFAKIVKRDLEDLKKGQLIVGFSMEVQIPENLYDLEFMMVESKVYFEPYYQVLNVLKRMSIENFPMERYIIDVSTDSHLPHYLREGDPVLTIKGRAFSPLAWGNRQFYDLNTAQNEAFQAALTKEFAIIQGPPGTGKTFLGLKIAETLLRNHSLWYRQTPMLVICFTNHALDQFLEGLMPITDKLIRVGGQSKNEKVNAFNLRKLTRGQKEATHQKREEVRDYISEISHINDTLNRIEKCMDVFEFQVFSAIVPNFSNSWFKQATNKQIFEWLLGGGQQHFWGAEPVPVIPNVVKPDEEDNIFGIMDEETRDIVDEIFQNVTIQSFSLTSLRDLSIIIKDIQTRINLLENADMAYWDKVNENDRLSFELYMAQHQLELLKYRLETGAKMKDNIVAPDVIDMLNPYRMTPDDRWQLYFYWISLYEISLRRRKEFLSQDFRRIYSVYTEMRDMEDTETMKDALVVGMTTTGAARLQSSLQALKSPIVIVEEAAEVLEAHIISALTSRCQHLILIGDHQQLKPSTANFKIETKYLLGVSLFERMVANNIQCHTLNVQHRMRPEIANLIRPSIYPVLDDHESVFDRPDISGVEHNLFFIDHNEKEEVCGDSSKKNFHEARFLIEFAKHLILNGYKPEDITILAAYLGQMFEMQRERKTDSCHHLLQDVRIAVLDNYQGEESDIVLLSLVRSNDENRIGFLKIENRVCVALSRARNGFYIMGNMQQLCDNSDIWPKIRETLENQKAIGPHLTLRCQIHRHRVTNVQTANDFSKLSEGGCDLLCEAGLKCGHVCKRLCHVDDREHINYNCQEKCENLLCDNIKHACLKLCYQECGACHYPVERNLKCGHSVMMECHQDPDKYECPVNVEAVLPCDHKTTKPCGKDPEKFPCPFPCDTRVEPCGHSCAKNCHVRNDPDHLQYKCMKPCEKTLEGCTNKEESHKCEKMCFEECTSCYIPVLKKLTNCDHMLRMACSANPDNVVCQKPCKKMLPCGHQCKNLCFEPCGDCTVQVEKVVPDCNHTIKIECCETPDRVFCKGTCPRPLKCGHLCGKKCYEDCRTRCKEIVDCSLTSPCGHIIRKISCYNKANYDDNILLQNCSEICNVELKCKHRCTGTCGGCVQGRFHQRCTEKCGVPLVCNHECPIPCRESCKPCRNKCEYKCIHSLCRKPCGAPCTTCKEKCPRSCPHQKCKRICGQICSVPPCSKPCNKKLKCGHDCVGFCGDPCPPICRICNEEELTEIYLGNEDDPNARFVLLKDCGHIIESAGMETWLQTDQDEIKPKCCPKCKTVIKTTSRYSDFVKQNMEDLMKVKQKFFGNPKDIQYLKRKINTRMTLLNSKLTKHVTLTGSYKLLTELFIKISRRISATVKDRKQNISKMDLEAIKMKVDLIETLADFCKHSVSLYSNQVNLIASQLSKDIDSISQQEIDDVLLEIDRLNRWVQFEDIIRARSISTSAVQTQYHFQKSKITKLLETPSRYNTTLDAEIKKELEEMKKLLASTIVLTDTERRQIVAAIGLSRGHWYKCPNGHPYAIGECGGAMQESRCYECGVAIGGRNHALLTGNTVATEMDGATHAAWSEQANMLNYQL